MQKISLIRLYLIFLKIGAILLGGGYVILPIITSELTEKRSILTEEEIIDYFALSQSLPGIIAANISMLAGYKIGKISGAITAMLGIVTVPIIVIICLAAIIGTLTDNHYINGALIGVSAAVITLILLAAREIWQKSEKNVFFYVILILSLLALLVFKFTPAQTIVCFSAFGVIYKYLSEREGEK